MHAPLPPTLNESGGQGAHAPFMTPDPGAHTHAVALVLPAGDVVCGEHAMHDAASREYVPRGHAYVMATASPSESTLSAVGSKMSLPAKYANPAEPRGTAPRALGEEDQMPQIISNASHRSINCPIITRWYCARPLSTAVRAGNRSYTPCTSGSAAEVTSTCERSIGADVSHVAMA